MASLSLCCNCLISALSNLIFKEWNSREEDQLWLPDVGLLLLASSCGVPKDSLTSPYYDPRYSEDLCWLFGFWHFSLFILALKNPNCSHLQNQTGSALSSLRIEIISITLRSRLCLQKNQCCSSNDFIQIKDKILQYLLYLYKSLYIKSKFE